MVINKRFGGCLEIWKTENCVYERFYVPWPRQKIICKIWFWQVKERKLEKKIKQITRAKLANQIFSTQLLIYFWNITLVYQQHANILWFFLFKISLIINKILWNTLNSFFELNECSKEKFYQKYPSIKSLLWKKKSWPCLFSNEVKEVCNSYLLW